MYLLKTINDEAAKMKRAENLDNIILSIDILDKCEKRRKDIDNPILFVSILEGNGKRESRFISRYTDDVNTVDPYAVLRVEDKPSNMNAHSEGPY